MYHRFEYQDPQYNNNRFLFSRQYLKISNWEAAICWQKKKYYTEVSELILSTNLFESWSMISSDRWKWGSLVTWHNSETSPCLNWKIVPGWMSLYSNLSETRDHEWTSLISLSFWKTNVMKKISIYYNNWFEIMYNLLKSKMLFFKKELLFQSIFFLVL